MKSRLILNLVLLLALVALALYAYFRPTEDATPKILISALERDDIDRVRLERGDNLDIRMEKRHGTWYMSYPHQTRVDPLQVDRLLDVAMASASDEFPADNLSRYGLDPASARVTLNDQSFAFGSINEVTNEQYLASGQNLYLVRTYLGYSLPNDITKLISRNLLAGHEKPVEFDFGKWQAVRNEKGGWTIQGKSPGDHDVAPSPDELNIWAMEWQLASALSAMPATETPPGEQVVIRFSNGDSATFRILAREPDVQLLRVDENMRYQLGADAGGRLLDPYRVAKP